MTTPATNRPRNLSPDSLKTANVALYKEWKHSNPLSSDVIDDLPNLVLPLETPMQPTAPFRCVSKAVVTSVFLFGSFSAFAFQAVKTPPVAKPAATKQNSNPKSTVGPNQNQEHLAQWMDRHSSLPLARQQSELQREPGFHQLPQQTQQRMLERLNQLNNMPEDQRHRILERNEALEHLTQPQRQQVREAMQQLGALPVERRRLVARAFRDLREMPDQQRQVILSSDRIRDQFSDQERSTLTNLLTVEPYLPVQRSTESINAGK
jgi:hypothetical protein